MSVTEQENLTPAQEATAAVADPQTPEEFWKHNIEAVLKSIVGLVPFRHEGEAGRIIIALDNLHEDIQDVLNRDEPIAPTVGQADPVLQALIRRNDELESKLNQVLDAIRSGAVAGSGTAVTTPVETTPDENTTAATIDPTPVTASTETTPSYPPGWTQDASGNWIQTDATVTEPTATTDTTADVSSTAPAPGTTT